MKFRLKADATFEAQDLDCALILLSLHFQHTMDSGLIDSGYIDLYQHPGDGDGIYALAGPAAEPSHEPPPVWWRNFFGGRSR